MSTDVAGAPMVLIAAQRRVEPSLRAAVGETWPASFADAMVYPIDTGGKRVRPALHFAAWRAVTGGDVADAPVDAAVAVELVHTYSLVHDDLPAMDDDVERRGRPTVHVAFDEATAILAGDALLTEAFAVLARAPFPSDVRVELVARLARAAGARGMVGGQVADLTLGAGVSDEVTLSRLHGLKTGALLSFAAVSGGLVGGASPDALARLTRYGDDVGLAFQLADDWLDADEADDPDGPPSYVRLLGAAETHRRANLLIERAIEAVRPLPQPDALIALARFTVERSV
jgi:geranylgeranyl pyrophosphate synthase